MQCICNVYVTKYINASGVGCSQFGMSDKAEVIDFQSICKVVPIRESTLRRLIQQRIVTPTRDRRRLYFDKMQIIAISLHEACRQDGAKGKDIDEAAKTLAAMTERELLDRFLQGFQTIRLKNSGPDIDVWRLWQATNEGLRTIRRQQGGPTND